MKYGSRRDVNHKTLEGAFIRMGFETIDTSDLGRGFPDFLVLDRRKRHPRIRMVEVKNPSTAYGKKGLSESQSNLERRGWPIEVVYDMDDVVTLAKQWEKR